jgi:opacity protein-like surface antigen
MMVRLMRALTATAILVFAAGAQGQATKPWYVAGGLGGAWYSDLPLSGAATGNLAMDTGFNVNAAFGRYLDDIRVFRLEVEALYARAGIGNNGSVNTGGDISNVGVMFNVLYDIQTNSSWIPYFGGGIGNSWVSLEDYSAGGVPVADDTGNAFSWQSKGGVAYQFNPSMAITVQYRYYGTDNVTFKTPAGGSIGTNGTEIQSAEVGFRFHF